MTDHEAQPPLFDAPISHDALDPSARKVLWWPWKDRQAMEGEYDELPPMFHRGRSVVNGPSVDGYMDLGQQITAEINADPDEVRRLRRARQEAREGDMIPLREALRQLEDEPRTQGCGWCAPSP